MEKMVDINIEKIMEEIRNEIKDKGYTNDMLSFNDVQVDSTDVNVNKFDKVVFNEELYTLNTLWNIQLYHNLGDAKGIKSKIIVFIKRVIRKCVKFYIEPIINEQSTFNATAVRTFNLLNCYITEQTKLESDQEDEAIIHSVLKQNKELKETIDQLLLRQERLEQSLAEIRRKNEE